MTAEKSNKIVLILFAAFSCICIFLREKISESIIFGIKLSATSIIPTLFPFFVISDYLSQSLIFSENSMISKGFEKFLKIDRRAFYAFLLGNLCGFPLGVRCGKELYENGVIGKNEYERLSGLSNNPSMGFTVSVIGASLLGNLWLGILLYFSIIISTVLTGFIYSFKGEKERKFDIIYEQKFDLSKSIKSAGMSSISVSSFIIFFSAIIGIIKSFIKYEPLTIILGLLTEIGNGAIMLASVSYFPQPILFSLIGFGLGFSGISVHLQAFSYFDATISKKKYLSIKFTEGAIAFIITYFISIFVF